jgi:hypothetical protein
MSDMLFFSELDFREKYGSADLLPDFLCLERPCFSASADF